MSEVKVIPQENLIEENLESQTDPEKAEDSEYRNFKEEPGDDDGENRNPEKRHSIFLTSMLVIKFIIGSGVLNLPQIFKTFGIVWGICFGIFFNATVLFTIYLLLKSKDITQRYSLTLFSRMTMGYIGLVLTKFCLIFMRVATNCAHFITFSSLIRNIFLAILGEKSDGFYFNSKFILIVLAILLIPLMFQKDISGISRFTHIGIIALGILFLSTIILFIFKYINGELPPFQTKMLYLNKEASLSEYFTCFGAFFDVFIFQQDTFPLYLPLHPRNTKNMMIAGLIGSIIATIIYIFFGILGFLMYQDEIRDSLVRNIGQELLRFVGNNVFMTTVLVICEFSFTINSGFSSILGFYVANRNFIGVLKYIYKKFIFKKKEDEGTQLEEVDDKGIAINKTKKEKDEIIGPKMQLIITSCFYITVVSLALTTTKIIEFANFNGATVTNFVCVMSPAIYYLYFSRKKQFNFLKIVSIGLFIFGFLLIIGFLLFNREYSFFL